MVCGFLLIVLYAGLAILPAAVATILARETEGFFVELGKNCALMGIAVLTLQFALAARLKWTERPFGLDILIRFHQHMALFATALLLLHPLLLAAGGKGWNLLYGLALPWNIWLGKIALFLLLVNAGLSKFQKRMRIPFEKWRLGHDILAPVLLVLVFLHSWSTGRDLQSAPMAALWGVGLTSATLLFVYHRFLRPRRLRRRPFVVTDVRPETEDVWTVCLKPPKGEKAPAHLPGQFHFITFFRAPDLPVEEHHWTISSSPAAGDRICSTIKALGDFTATMGRTKPGDTAAVHGPFGRFSHALHPAETDLVFVAGGIGITPLMSMLRFMRDTGDSRSVILLYANPKEKGIVFRHELEEIEAAGRPALKVVHVLNSPGAGWRGEIGHVDAEKITRCCGADLEGKVFYVCGPPPMLKAVVAALKTMGVPDRRIRAEIFSFLD